MSQAVRSHHYRVFLAIAVVMLFVFHAVIFNAEAFYGGDLLNHYIPHKQFLKESVAGGSLPLWNPYIFSGQPFVANIQTGVFYPPAWLCLILPVPYAFSLLVVLHFYCAAVSMFYCAKLFFARLESCVLAAAIFPFSGFFLSRLYPGLLLVIFAASWVPLIFYLAERLYRERTAKFSLLLGAALALQILCGAPQIALYTLIALALFIAFQLAWRNRSADSNSTRHPIAPRLDLIRKVVLAALLASGLVAVQVLPARELSRLTAERATGASWDYVTKDSLEWRYVTTFLAPNFFYDPTVEGLYWGGRQAYWEVNAYLGILPFLLALVPFLFIGSARKALSDVRYSPAHALHRSRLLFFCLTGSIVFLWLSFGGNSALFRLMYLVVPGLKFFRVPARWLLLYTFCMSFLASFGFDIVRTISQSSAKALARRCILAVLLVAGIIAGLSIAGLVNIPATMTHFNIQDMRPQDSFSQPSRYLLDLMGATRNSLLLTAALAALSAAAILLLFVKRLPPVAPLAALACLLAFDLGNHGAKFLQTRPFGEFSRAFYPETELVQYLKQAARDTRVTYLDHVFYWFNDQNQIELFSNRGMMHHLYEARGYDPLYLRSYLQYVNAISQLPLESVWGTFVSLEEIKNADLLSLLNVGYVLSYENVGAPGYALVKHFAFGLNVYHNKNARGWVFLAKSVDAAPLNVQEMFSRLADPQFDSLHRVFTEGNVSHATTECAPADRESVSVATRSPDHSVYHVSVRDSDVLVFSESYYPGWQVCVDGRPQSVVKVNGALSGVFVPPGVHTVDKTFAPFTFRLGLALSLVSLFVLIAGIVLCSKDRAVMPE